MASSVSTPVASVQQTTKHSHTEMDLAKSEPAAKPQSAEPIAKPQSAETAARPQLADPPAESETVNKEPAPSEITPQQTNGVKEKSAQDSLSGKSEPPPKESVQSSENSGTSLNSTPVQPPDSENSAADQKSVLSSTLPPTSAQEPIKPDVAKSVLPESKTVPSETEKKASDLATSDAKIDSNATGTNNESSKSNKSSPPSTDSSQQKNNSTHDVSKISVKSKPEPMDTTNNAAPENQPTDKLPSKSTPASVVTANTSNPPKPDANSPATNISNPSKSIAASPDTNTSNPPKPNAATPKSSSKSTQEDNGEPSEKKAKMSSSSSGSKGSKSPEYILEYMDKTFDQRRKIITKQMPTIPELKEIYPDLFMGKQLLIEFQRITKIDIDQKVQEFCVRYATAVIEMARGKKGSAPVLARWEKAKQENETLKQYWDMVTALCLLPLHFGENFVDMVLEIGEDEEVVAQGKIVPTLVARGSIFRTDEFFLIAENTIVQEFEEFTIAFASLYSSYWVFNMVYPDSIENTYNYIQRCIVRQREPGSIPTVCKNFTKALQKWNKAKDGK